jgi:hypothetical protein
MGNVDLMTAHMRRSDTGASSLAALNLKGLEHGEKRPEDDVGATLVVAPTGGNP